MSPFPHVCDARPRGRNDYVTPAIHTTNAWFCFARIIQKGILYPCRTTFCSHSSLRNWVAGFNKISIDLAWYYPVSSGASETETTSDVLRQRGDGMLQVRLLCVVVTRTTVAMRGGPCGVGGHPLSFGIWDVVAGMSGGQAVGSPLLHYSRVEEGTAFSRNLRFPRFCRI